MLFLQPDPHPVCCVPLFAWRLPVAFQYAFNVIFNWPQPRLVPDDLLPVRRGRTGDRLAHHPPVNAVLPRQTFDRLSGCVPAPDLFE
jgi:hypothetical protein